MTTTPTSASKGARGAQLKPLAQSLHRLLTMTEPLQTAAKGGTVRPTGKPTAEQWRAFIAEARHTDYWLGQAEAAARQVSRVMKDAGVDPASPQSLAGLAGYSAAHPQRAAILEVLGRYGIEATLVARVDRRLQETKGNASAAFGVATIDELIAKISPTRQRFAERIEKNLRPVRDPKRWQELVNPPAPRSAPGGNGTDFMVNCDELPPPLDIVCTVLVLIAAAVMVMILLADLIVALADALGADNRLRDEIDNLKCPEIAAFADSQLQGMFETLLGGFCSNGDERAILKVLGCLPCGRVATVVRGVGEADIIDRFQGPELGTLIGRLRTCGVLDFTKFDDDATRVFIESVSSATLAALPLSEVHQMVLNLFKGVTGNPDERAILKLLAARDCATVHELLGLPGTSRRDFDRKFEGPQQGTLNALFGGCGL